MRWRPGVGWCGAGSRCGSTEQRHRTPSSLISWLSSPTVTGATRLELRPNERTEIVFFLGEAATALDARGLIARYRTADLDEVLRAVTGYSVAPWCR